MKNLKVLNRGNIETPVEILAKRIFTGDAKNLLDEAEKFGESDDIKGCYRIIVDNFQGGTV